MKKIGILGGGQLARMLSLAGYPLGHRFRIYDSKPGVTAGLSAELFTGEYDDKELLKKFAAGLDVITYEFENVPVDTAEFLQQYCEVHPDPKALFYSQERIREKDFFNSLEISTASYKEVNSHMDLHIAIEEIGLPFVLKTRKFGYDGKGQALVKTKEDAEAFVNQFKTPELICEGFVKFERELSIVAVRDKIGNIVFYPLVENHHHNGILYKTIAPGENVSGELQAKAENYARLVLNELDYAGTIAIELFDTGDDLIANEMAPRVHNSGHWSMDGAVTGQFENHIRAVAGMPLGSTKIRENTVMFNIIGRLPEINELLMIEGVHLHLYDKEPKPGRKIGHVNICCKEINRCNGKIEAAEKLLKNIYT